jgi:hypothetical protein
LVGRLRSRVSVLDVDEAADAIEELMAALKPFADDAEEYYSDKNRCPDGEIVGVLVDYLRAAHAALGEKE